MTVASLNFVKFQFKNAHKIIYIYITIKDFYIKFG